MRVLNTKGISSQRQLSAHAQAEILRDELHSIATMVRGEVEMTNLIRDIGLNATGSVTVAIYISRRTRDAGHQEMRLGQNMQAHCHLLNS